MKHLIISQNGEPYLKFPLYCSYYEIINNKLYVDSRGCQFRFNLNKYEYKIEKQGF